MGKEKSHSIFHPLSRSNMKSIKEAKERKFPSFRFEKGQGQSVFKDELHVSLNNQAPMDLSCASCAGPQASSGRQSVSTCLLSGVIPDFFPSLPLTQVPFPLNFSISQFLNPKIDD